MCFLLFFFFKFLSLSQLQRESSDNKVAAQKLEGQLRHTSDLLDQKQHELQLTQAKREELEREMGKVLGRIEVLESREKNKVSCVVFWKTLLVGPLIEFFESQRIL